MNSERRFRARGAHLRPPRASNGDGDALEDADAGEGSTRALTIGAAERASSSSLRNSVLVLVAVVFACLALAWVVDRAYVQPLFVRPSQGDGDNGGAAGLFAYAMPVPGRTAVKVNVARCTADAGFSLVLALPASASPRVREVRDAETGEALDVERLETADAAVPPWVGDVPPDTTAWRVRSRTTRTTKLFAAHVQVPVSRALRRNEVVWIGVGDVGVDSS